MIISHKHKFIFIKTKKTAGTTVEIALSRICGPNDVITPISKKDRSARKEFANITAQNCFIPIYKYKKKDLLKCLAERKPIQFYNHISCQEVKRFVPKKVWDNYYKFTIERNPFDKIVSLYYWRGGHKKYTSIYDFIVNGGLKGFNSYDIYAIDGVVSVDKIYKYENLNYFCEDIKDKLGLKEQLKIPKYKAKSGYRKVKNYKDILDEKSVELIKTTFARELKLLNYEY